MIMKFTANVRIMVGAGLILRHPFSCKFPVGDLRENVKMCDLWFTYSEFSVNLLLNHVLERYNEYASSDLNKIIWKCVLVYN